MNLKFISGLVCCCLLAGCVRGLDVNKTPINIGFRPVIGHDTRAEESVPFPEDRSFRLWAQQSLDGAMCIEDEAISYNKGWFSSATWPESALWFEACWPTDIEVDYSKTKGLQLKSFDCSAGDVDILFAREVAGHDADSMITLRFDHILSRIEFRMLHSLSEEVSVRVKKIEVKGLALTGDYNVQEPRQWTVSDANSSFVAYDAGDADGIVIQLGKAQYVGKDFYTIPQVCYASVDVSYEVSYGNMNWIPQKETINSLDTILEPSKHYTYTLNLRTDKLTHTTGISSWSNR